MPTLQSHEAEIYYELHGESTELPPVVFAHGAGGNRISWWQQVPHFSKQRRVVTFDHRSFGRSQCAPDHFHPHLFADDLFAILDAEQIERAALVCQSMGGWTGLRAAVEHPERVACLVLGGTPGGLDIPAVHDAMTKIGSRIGDEGIVANAALAPSYPEREPAMAHLYDQISALNTGVDPAALGRLMAPESRLSVDSLEGFAVPTLILAGEHDLLFPPATLREVAKRVPNAAIEELAVAGHSTYFELPDAFNSLVDEFLARHAG
jgi:3-oxoadipate enol-lactonase